MVLLKNAQQLSNTPSNKSTGTQPLTSRKGPDHPLIDDVYRESASSRDYPSASATENPIRTTMSQRKMVRM